MPFETLLVLFATQIVGPSRMGGTPTANRGGRTLALAAVNHPAWYTSAGLPLKYNALLHM